MDFSVGQLFVTGGWVMWPLAVFSVLTWAIIFERAYVYLTLRPRLQSLAGSLIQSLRSGDVDTAKRILHSEKPYVSELFLGALDRRRNREDAERVTERNRLRLMAYFKKHLWVLGTIGSASPFIGLLGTVVGIIRAFGDMAEKGSGGFAVVAAGISEALVATGAGLVVAIVALMTYNVFINAANQTLTGLKLTLDEILDESFQATQAASR